MKRAHETVDLGNGGDDEEDHDEPSERRSELVRLVRVALADGGGDELKKRTNHQLKSHTTSARPLQRTLTKLLASTNV